jgi:hypothetical protein
MYDDEYLAILDAINALNRIDLRRHRAHPDFKTSVSEARDSLQTLVKEFLEVEKSHAS